MVSRRDSLAVLTGDHREESLSQAWVPNSLSVAVAGRRIIASRVTHKTRSPKDMREQEWRYRATGFWNQERHQGAYYEEGG